MWDTMREAVRKCMPSFVIRMKRRAARRLREWQRCRRPKLSEADFRRILVDVLGVRPGAVVLVHSSIGNLNLGFPPHRVLDMLLEAVGQEGTLLFPAWHFQVRAEEYLRRGQVFDVRNDPPRLGLIPFLAARRRNAVRTPHPTNSVVAIGKHALALTEGHTRSIYPCGAESPFYRIVHYDGIIIGLGVGVENLSFVHCVEDIMQDKFPVKTRTTEVFCGRVRDEDGGEFVVKTVAAEKRIQHRNVPRYMRRYIPVDVCRLVTLHGVRYFTIKACELYEAMESLANRSITIYSRRVYRDRDA